MTDIKSNKDYDCHIVVYRSGAFVYLTIFDLWMPMDHIGEYFLGFHQ